MSLHRSLDPDHIDDEDQVVPVWDFLTFMGFQKDDIKKVVGFLVLRSLALPISEIREAAREMNLVIPDGPTFES